MTFISAAEFKKHSAVQLRLIAEISDHIGIIQESVDKMIEARKKANKIEEAKKRAYAYADNVKPFFDTIRYNVDKLELLVDDEMWPLPKYRELLYTK